MSQSNGLSEHASPLWRGENTGGTAGFVPGGQLRPGERASATVGPAGRVVIPAALRAALGLEEGTELVLTVVGEELRMITPAAALRRAQARVAALFPGNDSLADVLIAERKRENARD